MIRLSSIPLVTILVRVLDEYIQQLSCAFVTYVYGGNRLNIGRNKQGNETQDKNYCM